jgi:hypothetical protein
MEANNKNGANNKTKAPQKWRSEIEPQLYSLKGYSAWVRRVRSALEREAEHALQQKQAERRTTDR